MSVKLRKVIDGLFIMLAVGLVYAYYLYIDYLFYPAC